MTVDTSAPDMPPESHTAPALTQGDRFRLVLEAALLNRRLLGVILLIVLTGLVTRTLLVARETPSRRAMSELYSDSYEALNAVKSAYTPELIFASPAANSAAPPVSAPHRNMVTPRHPDIASAASDRHSEIAPNAASPLKSGHSAKTPFKSRSLSKSLEQTQGDRAVQKWRDTVHSKQARAAEWRRMGIVLALFQHPGALDALAHIGDKFPPSIAASRTRRASVESGNSNIDPFGHGRTGVSISEEMAVWQALYGATKVTPDQLPGLQKTLKQLRLGWFEPIVLAQLYRKAGLQSEALRVAKEADRTARTVRALQNIQINSILFGFVGLFFCGVFALGRRLQPDRRTRDEKHAHAFDTQKVPLSLLAPSAVKSARIAPLHPGQRIRAPFQTILRNVPATRLVSALLLAFIVYLVGHTFLGFAFRYALRPFSDRLDHLNAMQLMRLNFALQFLLYIPVFLVPLWTLRGRLTSYLHSKQSPDLRSLLADAGYRTQSLLAEARAGVGAYLLLMPGLVLAGLISHALFHRFHTPVNPAQFETMAAQQTLDKVLIFIIAAVIAPIVEETMFRGLLYSALRERFGIMGAAMLSAAVFSLVHPTLPGGFLTIWAIGVALALVYERRGSLLPGMILHGIHNGLITLLGFAVFGS